MEDTSLLDLGYLAVWATSWGLLEILLTVAAAIAAFLDFNIPVINFRPFSGVSAFITNDVIEPVQDAQHGVEAQLAKGFHGLVNSLTLIVGLTGLALIGLKDLLVWLWTSRINPLVDAVAQAIGAAVEAVSTELQHLREAVVADFETAYDYVDSRVADAITSSEAYAKAHAEAALDTATSYADTAVAGLRAIEDKAIENAVDLANAAASTAAADLKAARDYADSQIAAASGALVALIDAARNAAEEAAADALGAAVTRLDSAVADARAAAASGVATAEADAKNLVGSAVDSLTGQINSLGASTRAGLASLAASASGALASASGALSTEISAAVSGAEAIASAGDQAVQSALEQVKSIAITAETDVETLAGSAGIAGSAALIASIPALATLVYAIANEAGLSDAGCRQKVGQVCSVNPSAWEGLLAGLLAGGLAFSLQDIVDSANALLPAAMPVLEQAIKA